MDPVRSVELSLAMPLLHSSIRQKIRVRRSCQSMRMKISLVAATALSVLPSSLSIDAFAPKKAFVSSPNKQPTTPQRPLNAATIEEVSTSPIEGMKPGTSGLRKKVEVWQGIEETNKYYVENFIQSLLDTAQSNNGGNSLDT